MPRAGPKKVQEYSAEFKLAAVRLSRQRGVQVQAVAAALDIHPFMLSRWRKEAREGRIKARTAVAPEARQQRDVTELARIKRQYALLQEEHELLKKAIRFCSARARTSTGSSRASVGRSK